MTGAALLALAVPVVVWDLTVSDQAFTPYGDVGQWEWGTAEVGPTEELGWGTNLDDLYLHYATDYLELPPVDLTGVARPVLVLRHWYAIAQGDRGTVEVDDGGGWQPVDPIYGYPDPVGFEGTADWHDVYIDLDGIGDNPQVRLAFEANDDGIADDGWYVQRAAIYDGDVAPPQITMVAAPSDTQDLDGPYVVAVLVEDDVGVLGADIVLRIDGGPTVVQPLVSAGAGVWEADIPGQPPDTRVQWYVEAHDAEQTTRLPAAGSRQFRVFLAAPTGLEGPLEGRNVDNEALLTWDPPISPHPVVGYQVVQAGVVGSPLGVPETQALVSLAPNEPQTFHVRAVYDVGVGDRSSSISLDIEVPELAPLSPAGGYPGETLWVEVSGHSLYLMQGPSRLQLGTGVDVRSLAVHDVGNALALVSIAADAPIGDRTVTVTGTQGVFAFPDAFAVLDGADAPAVIAVKPASGVQGAAVTLKVTASEDFAGPVLVDPGEDIVVASTPVVDSDRVRVDLAIHGDARIGTHTLVLDDGKRLWTVDFEVEERIFQAQKSCGCTTGGALPAGGAWPVLVLLWLSRRRTR